MRILSLNPVQENCRLCKRAFSNNVGMFFNPVGYMPGLCQDCNHTIMKDLLSKGHTIFKYDYIISLNDKY
jgi:hypothetical protein